jgi:anti-anti-sigma factor
MLPIISAIPLRDGAVCVRLIGEFDLAAASSLRDHLHRAIAGSRDVVVSTSGVTFFDCTCLGTLNWARLQAAEHGGRLCLVGSARPVLRLLTLTNMLEHFEQYPDLDSAMEVIG